MEILQFLLSFFVKEYGGEGLQAILKLLQDNSFDLKKVLSNLNPQSIAPIIGSFMKSNTNFKSSPSNDEEKPCGLTPIERFADKRIVNCLNGYFA